MSLILCGDPEQDQQENSLLRFTMIYFARTGSTGKFTLEIYYDLLWKAAYQHDLNKATKQTQRKAFISHQNDPCDDFEYDPEEEDSAVDQSQDKPSPYSVFQSSFNSSASKKPTKVFIPYQLWAEFPEVAKQMVIEYNKKVQSGQSQTTFQ